MSTRATEREFTETEIQASKTDWTKTQNRITHAALVYQGGLANVFQTGKQYSGPRGTLLHEHKRLLQADFRACENFALGMQAAGVDVITMYCNLAGDISESEWFNGLDDAPFSGEFRPVGTFVR